MKRIRIKTWIKIVFFLIVIISSTVLYSRYVEIKQFKVKEYNVINSNIPNSFYGFKIVQISDIHYKMINDDKYLKKIVNKINLIKPDIVILNGDLFDKNIDYAQDDFDNIKKILKGINYNIGKYAIKGDNDLNIDNWEDVINDSDFINLNDKYELIYNNGIEPILLMGISSNYKKNHIKNTITDLYNEINKDYKYSILVLHEPDFINYIDYSNYNLILAGHSLNGQIKIPFIGGIIQNKYSKVYYDEFYNLGKTKLYISSGIGTGKYKFRLFNGPSISLYRLRNK